MPKTVCYHHSYLIQILHSPTLCTHQIKAKPLMHEVCSSNIGINIDRLRHPLSDITPSSNKKAAPLSTDYYSNDHIPLNDEYGYVPDSVSPTPRPRFSKLSGSTEKDPIIRTVDFNQLSNERVTPNLPKTQNILSSKRLYMKDKDVGIENNSPEVIIIGESKLSSRLKDMTTKSEMLYNSSLTEPVAKSTPTTPVSANGVIPVLSSEVGPSGSRFVARESSTGGKLPRYGPRRVAIPNQLYAGEFVNDRPKFSCTQSEIMNYNAICHLASSEHKDARAVDIGGVHCTFKSFGDSLKPGGVVSNFVIAVFIRHLFSKPGSITTFPTLETIF